MSNINITIVRHAPTAYNAQAMFMGTLDIPIMKIDPVSLRNFRELSGDKAPGICYVSPLSRAHGTAMALYPDACMRIDKRLVERDLGAWTGIPKEEARALYPSAFSQNGKSMDFFYSPPAGESWKALVERVADFLVGMFGGEKDAAIVSHNGVIRVMKSLITGEGMVESYGRDEPHLVPQSFSLDDATIAKIRENPLYTVPPRGEFIGA